MRNNGPEQRVERGRDHIASLAEADGEIIFARQVRAGAWDHRSDVAAAIRSFEEGYNHVD